MKTYILSALLFFVNSFIIAQTTLDRSFHKRKIYHVAEQTSTNDLTKTNQSIIYIDPFGRVEQMKVLDYTPSGNTLVLPFEFDEFGRQVKNFLPYSNATNEEFDEAALTNQVSFYQNEPLVAHDGYPYSTVEYDNSPSDFIRSGKLMGNFWQNIAYPNNKIEISKINNVDLGAGNINAIRKWEITANGCVSVGYYAANELTGFESTSPENPAEATFTDKLGKVVYKRTLTAGKTLITCYVYNDFGKLAYVISPKAYRQMEISGVFDTSLLTEDLIYKYTYDEKGRLITKKIPGKLTSEYVYDNLDRVILSRDGNLTANHQWIYFKYDLLNRILAYGIYTDHQTLTQASMQIMANGYNAIDPNSEVRDGNVANPIVGYSNQSFPVLTITNHELLSIYYYDDYDYNYDGTDDVTYIASVTITGNPAFNNKNRLTGAISYKIGEQGSIWESYFYQFNTGKMIQLQQGEGLFNTLTDVNNQALNFIGQPTEMEQFRSYGNPDQVYVKNRYTYDRQNRLIKTYQKINADDEVVLSEIAYNSLGQGVVKNVHAENDNGIYLQEVNYEYNIFGALTKINDPQTLGVTDLFGFEILYDLPEMGGSVAKHNGNISETHWKSKSDNQWRGYSYRYDDLGQLTDAFYKRYGLKKSSWGWHLDGGRYDVNGLTYDYNGNILTLNRKGFRNNATYGDIDLLTYTYSGNRLLTVDDAYNGAAVNEDFEDNGSLAVTEFFYDNNGNINVDDNKGLTLWYNVLNLPELVDLGTGKQLKFVYNASGQLLEKKIIVNGNTTQTFQYKGKFMYEDNTLVAINSSEGRAVPDNSFGQTFRYEYYYKDHLGNIRMTFSDLNSDVIATTNEILQENHYYPFGGKLHGLNATQIGPENQFKFNGNELQTDDGFNWYNFNARFYMPDLGRFTGVDPLAEKNPDWTPYRFGFNNPIRFSDPTGLDEWDYYDDDDRNDYGDQDQGEWDPHIDFNETHGGNGEYIFLNIDLDLDGFADMFEGGDAPGESNGGDLGLDNDLHEQYDNEDQQNDGYDQHESQQESQQEQQNETTIDSPSQYNSEGDIAISTWNNVNQNSNILFHNLGKQDQVSIADNNGTVIWENTFTGNLNVNIGVLIEQFPNSFVNNNTITVTHVGYESPTAFQITFSNMTFGGFEVVPYVPSPSFRCFVAGTKILMENEKLRNIEDVKIGNVILNYNTTLNVIEKDTVTRVDKVIHDNIITIKFENNIENTNTDDHPYLVIGKGWCSLKPEETLDKYGIDCKRLDIGDECYFYDKLKKGTVPIKVIEIIKSSQPVPTYNLTGLKNNSNYFANGILVGNESNVIIK